MDLVYTMEITFTICKNKTDLEIGLKNDTSCPLLRPISHKTQLKEKMMKE